jgi:hypothetical protein
MRKVILITLIAVMAVGLMVSCEDSAVAERKEVDVSMAVSLEKTLSSRVDKDIVYWEFMATPKFTLAEGEKIHGIVSYWKDLSAMTTGADNKVKTTCSLGRYTSGDWLFELRALNAQHQVVAIGRTQQIIRDGLANTINIAVYVDRADGTPGESADTTSRITGVIAVSDTGAHTVMQLEGKASPLTTETGQIKAGFFINQLDATVSNLSITITRQKVGKDGKLATAETVTPDSGSTWTSYTAGQNVPEWYITEVTGTKETVPEGRLFYECGISGLSAGPYIYTFLISGKDKNNANVTLGGQSLDVLIIGGETTYVTGTMLANEYVLAGLKVTAPGLLVTTINNGKAYVKIGADNSIALTCTLDKTQSAESSVQKYYWYYTDPNGDLVSLSTDEASITFKAPLKDGVPVYGIYRISCSPVGQLGSIGTAVVDVIVNPAEGANVGEFDWSNVDGAETT